MKKSLLVLTCVLLALFTYGCGSSHKSDAELVDVEQFKCQESIQTVFEVLGETDITENQITGLYYEYEDINLWGYSGVLEFSVREDKDTIRDFECELTLTDKELEDVLSQLSAEYGSYETRDDGDGYKSYTWTISEKDEKVGYEEDELGYDSICIQNYGNDIYIVVFSDEWSIYKDELYFEKVEETQKSDDNILVEEEYDICGDTLTYMLLYEDDRIELFCGGEAQTREGANVLLTMMQTTCLTLPDTFDGYCIALAYKDGGCVSIWDGSNLIHKMMNEDGSIATGDADWYMSENPMSESELKEYIDTYQNAWAEFVKKVEELPN